MRNALLLAGAALAGAVLPSAALAQSCTIPPGLSASPRAEGKRRLVPVRGYTLALSWSPQHCRSAGAGDGDQCGAGNSFGMVLHGLWPDGAGGGADTAPQYCRPAGVAPRQVLRANFCATPSARLMQHEWAKHGTCMASTPAAYFTTASRLYRAIRLPDMAVLGRDPALTKARFAAAFARANPGMTPAMIRISDDDGWLDEVKLCLDTRLHHAECAGGRHDDRRLRISAPPSPR